MSVHLTSDLMCPHCGGRESMVTDSRGARDGSHIRRRRECGTCRRRYTTSEISVGHESREVRAMRKSVLAAMDLLRKAVTG